MKIPIFTSPQYFLRKYQSSFALWFCGKLRFFTRQSLVLTHSLVEIKTEVFDRTFFKKFVVSRGEAFGRSSQRAKHFIRKSAFLRAQKEPCSVATGNFAQSFMGKKANSRLKTCFQSTFLQEKKLSQTTGLHRLSPKSSQWEVFGSRNPLLDKIQITKNSFYNA